MLRDCTENLRGRLKVLSSGEDIFEAIHSLATMARRCPAASLPDRVYYIVWGIRSGLFLKGMTNRIRDLDAFV